MTLSAINRYPVKSCRGHALQQATVRREGIEGDRRWMITDPSGAVVTAREHPRMLLITPQLNEGGGITFTSHDGDRLRVPAPVANPTFDVRLWKSELRATLAPADADAWLTAVIGVPVRLVYLDDPTRRHANPLFAGPDAPVSFADGYPLLLTSTASLAALNTWIADGPNADEAPVPMMRFRPSVVIDGSQPWVEDGWRLLRIGAATFRVVKGCDRCTMTMTDPDTAARGKEPIATLARYRKWDGETWFGVNLVPVEDGATITVGDEVDIVESVAAPDGPPR